MKKCNKKLEQQMIADLLEIAELTQQPIKKMSLNNNGVFEELKELCSDVQSDQKHTSNIKGLTNKSQ